MRDTSKSASLKQVMSLPVSDWMPIEHSGKNSIGYSRDPVMGAGEGSVGQ